MKFTNNFKKKAIQLKKQGIHPNKIFTDADINISNKQKFYATKLINRWKGSSCKPILTSKNREDLNILKSIKSVSELKRIEYLEAKVAYLEAENSFLVELPRKKK